MYEYRIGPFWSLIFFYKIKAGRMNRNPAGK